MFGISTHLYLSDRLDRDHLVEIAAHGFEAVEVFAVRDHFDYHDRRAALALAEWLDDTRLMLHSMHAPIAATYTNGAWREGYSLAATDEARRLRAVEETTAALNLATLLAFQKVGYDGAWMFELAVAAERRPILERAVKARARFEALLAFGDEPPIETAAD